MQIEIEIPRAVETELNEAAQITGMKRQEIIKRALHHYAEEIKKFVELKKEISGWENLSDEAFENFERELWKEEKSG